MRKWKGGENVQTNEVLKRLRVVKQMTQDEMAEKLFVTRQAVSRWETGETTPNVEMLKQLSILFDVSINTLLGAPRKLFCQCCGMPLTEDAHISRETDGSFNEDYCTWCYHDGAFVYPTKENLIDDLVEHFSGPQFPQEQARSYYEQMLGQLTHWQGK